MADVTCAECGARPRWFTMSIQGIRCCPHCAAVRALAMLDPTGTQGTQAEIEEAAKTLRLATIIVSRERLVVFRERTRLCQTAVG